MGLSKQIYEQAQEEFLARCEEVENGNMTFIDAAVRNKEEMDYFAKLAEDRKSWLNENVDAIESEAEQYGKEGYNGFLFKKQYRETMSFKNIPEWAELEKSKKELEAKSKAAYMMVQKGGLNVDENGEEIPLPEVKTSSFIKIEKLK